MEYLVGWIFGIVLALVISLLVAEEFYKVAVMKGHPSRKYFWISFLLGIVGYLLVISLPVVTPSSSIINSDDLPDL